MNPNRYSRVVSTLATSLAVIGAGLVANAQTIPPNGQGLPAGAVFNPETRTFTWTPTAAQVGQHQVTFWVTDGIDTDSETITITVLPATDLNGNSDFNGDGNADLLYQSATSLGVHGRPYNGNGGAAGGSVAMDLGASAQLLGIVDMNGDDINDYIVRNLDGSNTYQVRLRNAGGSITATRNYNPGGADWRVVGAYDQNLDGYVDLVWQNVSTGRVAIWLINASGSYQSAMTLVSSMADYRVAAVGDMNADGNMDLLWQKVTENTTQLAAWYLDASGSRLSVKSIGSTTGGYRCVGLADYNSDNVNDIVWQQVSTGRVVVWYMNTSGTYSAVKLLDVVDPDRLVANWQWDLGVPAVVQQDEDGDGKADILWQDDTNGRTISWRMDGAWARESYVVVAAADNAPGKLVAIADMNNDRVNDYVWCRQELGNNVVTIWLMNANRTRNSSYVVSQTAASTYAFAGVGDMNSDGNQDLLWQEDATGRLAVWHMNGSGKTLSSATLAREMVGYRVRVVADMNQDGNADLILQRVNAGNTETLVYYMNGAGVKLSHRYMASVPQAWRMSCAGDYNGDGIMDVVFMNTSTKRVVGWELNAQNAATRNVVVLNNAGSYSVAGM